MPSMRHQADCRISIYFFVAFLSSSGICTTEVSKSSNLSSLIWSYVLIDFLARLRLNKTYSRTFASKFQSSRNLNFF